MSGIGTLGTGALSTTPPGGFGGATGAGGAAGAAGATPPGSSVGAGAVFVSTASPKSLALASPKPSASFGHISITPYPSHIELLKDNNKLLVHWQIENPNDPSKKITLSILVEADTLSPEDLEKVKAAREKGVQLIECDEKYKFSADLQDRFIESWAKMSDLVIALRMGTTDSKVSRIGFEDEKGDRIFTQSGSKINSSEVLGKLQEDLEKDLKSVGSGDLKELTRKQRVLVAIKGLSQHILGGHEERKKELETEYKGKIEEADKKLWARFSKSERDKLRDEKREKIAEIDVERARVLSQIARAEGELEKIVGDVGRAAAGSDVDAIVNKVLKNIAEVDTKRAADPAAAAANIAKIKHAGLQEIQEVLNASGKGGALAAVNAKFVQACALRFEGKTPDDVAKALILNAREFAALPTSGAHRNLAMALGFALPMAANEAPSRFVATGAPAGAPLGAHAPAPPLTPPLTPPGAHAPLAGAAPPHTAAPAPFPPLPTPLPITGTGLPPGFGPISMTPPPLDPGLAPITGMTPPPLGAPPPPLMPAPGSLGTAPATSMAAPPLAPLKRDLLDFAKDRIDFIMKGRDPSAVAAYGDPGTIKAFRDSAEHIKNAIAIINPYRDRGAKTDPEVLQANVQILGDMVQKIFKGSKAEAMGAKLAYVIANPGNYAGVVSFDTQDMLLMYEHPFSEICGPVLQFLGWEDGVKEALAKAAVLASADAKAAAEASPSAIPSASSTSSTAPPSLSADDVQKLAEKYEGILNDPFLEDKDDAMQKIEEQLKLKVPQAKEQISQAHAALKAAHKVGLDPESDTGSIENAVKVFSDIVKELGNPQIKNFYEKALESLEKSIEETNQKYMRDMFGNE